MDSLPDVLQRNLSTIRQRIERACRRSNRSADDVTLVAVTKYAEWDWVCALSEQHAIFGESRPQQLADRQPQLPRVQWHLIGQLQRNKARTAIRHAQVIHSVDSLKLLQRIHQLTAETEDRIELLLQVNVSGEASKSGFSPQELLDNWPQIAAFSSDRVRLSGLMTMAPKSESSEETRPIFAALRQLQRELNDQGACGELTELSMGMSRDFEAAVEEGATLIRIGSSLFEGLQRPDTSITEKT